MSKSSSKVAYFGLPLGALALLREGFDVRVACVSRTAVGGMRRLRRMIADRGGLLLAKPDLDDNGVANIIASARPDILVSWFWTRKIPPRILGVAPDRFGVHPSLLPRHRGPDPYFWAIASGDRRTGVTAHELSAEYDAGAVLACRELQIPDDANAARLAHLLDRESLQLMLDVTGRLADLEVLERRAQDDRDATQAPPPGDEECEILWSEPVEKVLRLIRAAAPDPGAFTGHGDDTIVIERARRFNGNADLLEPGDVARVGDEVLIRAADGAIVVERARLEGGAGALRGSAIVTLFPGIATLA